MKRLFLSLAVIAGLSGSYGAKAGSIWSRVDLQHAPSKDIQVFHPKQYLVYTMDEANLKMQMITLSTDPAEAQIISLPTPDGGYRNFRVWQTPMLPAELAAQFPDISTYTAEAVGAPTVTAKLDFTMYGFHAMVYDGENTYMVDPYDNYHDGYYMVHYRRDESREASQKMVCLKKSGIDQNGPAGESMHTAGSELPKLAHRVVNGYQLRTYKLALGCSHQYAQAATGLSSPTVAQTLAKMTTTMARVNGVYEREFSVTMVFVSNENALIHPVATGDPYGPDDSNPGALLDDHQTQCDAVIGNANYDIGHVFSTGGGGLALLGVVCETGAKAQGVTGSASPTGDGFDIDYVAHEMGHQFGSDHSFNNDNDGACGGNASPADAFEPGSGSTIMAYAGICSPDDLQQHSDAYFNAKSLLNIQAYIASNGNVCPVKTATGNKLPGYTSFSNTYSIPYQTPFELLAPVAVDSVGDSVLLYSWEEYDLGSFGSSFTATTATGPIFRSFNPSQSRLRIFPRLSMVLAGSLSDATSSGTRGEKAPTVARSMKFKCTYRAIRFNKGTFVFPDDSVVVNAVNTGTGFKVTSQGTTGISYTGGSTQTVTWDVVNSNTAPINASNVNIYMSVDGGNTWAYNLGSFSNTGTASVTVPNPATTSANCRFKVKGSGNVFFNINSKNFTVTYNSSIGVSTGVAQTGTLAKDTKVFPVPATDMVHITTGTLNNVQAIVVNTLGQTVWQGIINGQADVQVSTWAKGIYHVRLLSSEGNEQTVKSFVVE